MLRLFVAVLIATQSGLYAQVSGGRVIGRPPIKVGPPVVQPPARGDNRDEVRKPVQPVKPAPQRPVPVRPPVVRQPEPVVRPPVVRQPEPVRPPVVTPVQPPRVDRPVPVQPSPGHDVIVRPPVNPPVNVGRPDWDGRDARGQRRPPVVRFPGGGGGREVPQPITRVRVRPGQPVPSGRVRSLDPIVVRGRRVVVDGQRGLAMPSARVHVHVSRPRIVPSGPPVHIHRHRHLYTTHYVGSHWVWINGYYVELYYYWWGGNYWVWHDGHFDWWYPTYHYFWCDFYGVHLDWGYPTVFLTHVRTHYQPRPGEPSFISHPVVGDLLLKRGSDLLYKHGNHYDVSADEPSADELNFYCSDHHTYYELRLNRVAWTGGPLGDEVLIDGRLYTRIPQYDLYWDSEQGIYVSILTVVQ